MGDRSPLAALRSDRTVQAVVVLVVLALAARLAFLGRRLAHQDEARVGYWTLRFMVEGRYEYRAIVHGPFIHVVNRPLFELLGPSDFVMRLPMAVLGGVAPLSALLFRGRLRDSETVALAFLLAANPLLLYYSRFSRQDVPLAVFMLFALGFFLRGIDASTRRSTRNNVYAGALAFGLAFTTKENALLYVLCWIGGLVMLFDHRLFIARARAAVGGPDAGVADGPGRAGEGAGGGDPLSVALSYVPDPPAVAAVRIDGSTRALGTLLVLGANPLALFLAVGDPPGSFPLFLASLAALGGYLVSVRGVTVWHFSGAVPLLAVLGSAVLAAATGSAVTTTGSVSFALAWLFAAALLLDERVIDYGDADAPDAAASPTDAPGAGAGGADATAPGPDAGTTDPDAGGRPDGGRPGEGGESAATDEHGEPAATDRGEESGTTDQGGEPDDPADRGSRAAPDPRPDEGGRLNPGAVRVDVLPVLGVAYAVFLAVVVFFYAPRGGGYAGYPRAAGDATVGLYTALGSADPALWWAVVREATAGSWTEFLGLWGTSQDHAYIPYFVHFAESMWEGALVVTVAAPLGFVADRYAGDGPRDLVALGGYWGVASVLGYPLVTDIQAAWTAVHAVVPLAIPAAVALAAVYRLGAESLAADDAYSVLAAVVVLVAAAGLTGAAAADHVYQRPQDPDNHLVQYAQSSSTDMKPVLRDVRAVARENDGVDVLYYGDEFDSVNESVHDNPLAGEGWFGRLPLAWYFERYEIAAERSGGEFRVASTSSRATVGELDPAVVVALNGSEDVPVSYKADDVAAYLTNYSRYQGHRYLFDSAPSSLVIFVDTSTLSSPASTYGGTVPPGAGDPPPTRYEGGPGAIDCESVNGTAGDTGPLPGGLNGCDR